MSDVVYRYKGKNGEFLMHVPARDLTQADVDVLDEGPHADLVHHVRTKDGIYEKVADKPSAKANKRARKAARQAAAKEQPEGETTPAPVIPATDETAAPAAEKEATNG